MRGGVEGGVTRVWRVFYGSPCRGVGELGGVDGVRQVWWGWVGELGRTGVVGEGWGAG